MSKFNPELIQTITKYNARHCNIYYLQTIRAHGVNDYSVGAIQSDVIISIIMMLDSSKYVVLICI